MEENNQLNATLTNVTATDFDSDLNGKLTYHIKQVNASFTFKNATITTNSSLRSHSKQPTPSEYKLNRLKHPFSIDMLSGHLKVVAPLDRELFESYEIMIIVRDGGAPSLSASCVVHVKVGDQNDEKPTFEKSSISFNILENEPEGQFVKRL